ncbi:MAG: tetratricopeptide repeat protein [Bacteroidetes bacterium]|nr:tetratricopeptide repeat protein [Bacteroidota bacterium]
MAAITLDAQKNKADSLEKLLAQKSDDSLRLTRLLSLAKFELNLDGEKSMKYAREAMTLSARVDDDYKKGMALVSVGNVFLVVNGDADSAQKYFYDALKLAKSSNLRFLQGNVLNNLGSVAKMKNKLSDALDDYNDALFIREELHDSSGMAATMSNLGSIYEAKGEYKKSLEYYFRALPLKEKEGNKNSIANTLVNIGNTYIDMNKPEKALEFFMKVDLLETETGNLRMQAGNVNSMGIAYYELQKFDSAVYSYDRSLKIREELNDSAGMAECFNNIGNVYYAQKNAAKALEFYRKSMDLSAYIDDDHKLDFTCNFATGLSLAGKNDSALALMEDAKKINNAFSVPGFRLSILGAYVDIYENAGRYKDALNTLRERVSLNDSVYKSESMRQVDELEVKYESTKKQSTIDMLQKEQELLQKDKEKEKVFNYGLTAGSLLLLFVILIVLRSNRQKKKTNKMLAGQNKIIAEKNKDITDSITYARRIQQSVLPDEKILKENCSDYFIFNRPRDIVSGDFYWMAKKAERIYVAVADCTGHGVPGALVSVVGLNMLNKIIEENEMHDPSDILGKLHVLVINSLNKDASARDTRDGMDVALVCIDKKAGTILFSGASRPFYYSDKNGFHSIRGDRYSIAGEKKTDGPPFEQHEIKMEENFECWISSDGYADQFGEKTGKKFLAKKFGQLLVSVSGLPMKEQGEKIENAFLEWKGSAEQVDDVCVVGVRV